MKTYSVKCNSCHGERECVEPSEFKSIRATHGLTSIALARRLHLTPSRISRIESGMDRITVGSDVYKLYLALAELPASAGAAT